MKEYSIYQRHGSCSPFILHTYDNIYSAKMKLYDIIQTEEERRRPYFVDNDFYNNKYQFSNDLYYLKIIVRDVSDWADYSEEKEIEENNNKIIFINDFKKVLTN